jgi:hypothetical protein
MLIATIMLAALWIPLSARPDQTAPAGTREHTIAQELKSAEDPTLLKRRSWLDMEWNGFRDGSSDIQETLGVLWSWRVSSTQDWAVRLKLAYDWHLAGHAAGDSDLNGLGDMNLATGTAFRLGDSWRVGVGLDLLAPSGSELDLSANVWRLQEIGTLAWDATKSLTLSPSIEHNESMAEESGAPSAHYLEVFFPATVGLPQHWAATAKYEAKVDFKNDNTWTHSGKLAIAKELDRVPLSFSLSIEKTLDGGDKTVQLNFISTWFFRSRTPSSAEGRRQRLRPRTRSSEGCPVSAPRRVRAVGGGSTGGSLSFVSAFTAGCQQQHACEVGDDPGSVYANENRIPPPVREE